MNIAQFWADENLIFSIQQTTGDSTAKILGYFQHLMLKTAEDHFSKKKNNLNKTIKWTYGSIPYRLNIYGSKNHVVGSLKPYTIFRKLDIKKIIDQDAEFSLGLEGSIPVPNLAPPVLKAPLTIKKHLMSEDSSTAKTSLLNVDVDNLPQELKLKYGA